MCFANTAGLKLPDGSTHSGDCSSSSAIHAVTTLILKPTVALKRKSVGGEGSSTSLGLLDEARLPEGAVLESTEDASRRADVGMGWGGWNVGGSEEV